MRYPLRRPAILAGSNPGNSKVQQKASGCQAETFQFEAAQKQKTVGNPKATDRAGVPDLIPAPTFPDTQLRVG